MNLFPSKESLEPFLEELVPLLAGLVDDNSALTRQHTLRAICCFAALAARRGCFTAEILHKLYFGECLCVCEGTMLQLGSQKGPSGMS